MTPWALSLALLLLKLTGVLLAAVVASAVMSRTSASSRHTVWLVALAALLLVPALASWGPLHLPVLQATPVANAAPPISSAAAPGSEAATPARTPMTPQPSAGAPIVSSNAAAATHPLSITELLFFVWAAAALILLARLLYGAWSVRRIVRRAHPLEDPAWQTPLYEIADRLGLSAAPRLVRSSEVQMPFAAGLLSATIVLPAESDDWRADRRSAVLVHELGHVRRRDLIGHTLGRLACAFYWFHPLVWTAARRLRAESERACDDLALVFGARPSDYAEHLLEIVTCVRDHHTPAVALAMAHRKEFEGRMLAILDPSLRRKTPGRFETATVAAGLGAFAIVLSAAAPVARTVAAPDRMPAVNTAVQQPVQQPADTVRHEPVERPAPSSTAMSTRSEPPRSRVAAPSGDRVGALVHALTTDPNGSIRRVAAWGLADFTDSTAALNALVAAVQSDSDASVREMAAWALGNAPSGSAAGAALIKVLQKDPSRQVRSTAVWALGALGDPSAVSALLPSLSSTDPSLRELAAWAIGASGPEHAPSALIQALNDSSSQVRASVSWALYSIEDPAAASALSAAFARESDPEVRLDMIRALGAMGEPAVDALEKLVTSPDTTVRRIAISELAAGGASGPWVWPRPRPRPFAGGPTVSP